MFQVRQRTSEACSSSEDVKQSSSSSNSSGRRQVCLLPDLVNAEDKCAASRLNSQKSEKVQDYLKTLLSKTALSLRLERKPVNIRRENAEAICVDDDIVQHAVFRKSLSKQYTVYCFVGAEDALDFLSIRSCEGNLDCTRTVIVVDNILPGISGVDFVTEVRRRFASAFLPIVMVSGDNADSAAASAFEAGADDFVCKPVSPNNLASRVQAKQLSMIRHKAVHDELAQRNCLLEQMLPRPAIQNLASGQQLLYEKKRTVSVIFANVVSFQELTSTVGTDHLILMLHSLFSAYDELIDEHGVCKVEATGHRYMVVAGHLEPTRGDHARRAVNMATAMIEVVQSFHLPNGSPLRIRVGIHTGPAHAGMIGRKVPRYCFFGDTVNIASQMEASGFPNCVHVSQATYEQLCLECGDAMASELLVGFGSRPGKGRGREQTWLIRTGDWHEALSTVTAGSDP
uniref:Guanylate cyclase n=1 Tax=Tetraselmis sp. GSL018 TaxID=582737 RepID=A0A061S8X7_9CHLO|eukprot:CAMPEP_0177597816 /NCGR_PEP_ID=MMETSP0419_2-20121207/11939_1 /TAXON_ID=582737 /ORGANISM="Tetraselmis sp., Strain GSL018" /LENGTH=455 /DNA_ID=CAMNT_0019090063 /DNA_START=362 /DNA_END=1729 /DNA_ORIENTATION=-